MICIWFEFVQLTVAQLKAFAKSVGVHAGDKPLKGDWVRVIDVSLVFPCHSCFDHSIESTDRGLDTFQAHFEKRSAGNKVKRQRIV